MLSFNWLQIGFTRLSEAVFLWFITVKQLLLRIFILESKVGMHNYKN